MDSGTIPLSAVPILLQILSTPKHPNREEVLTLLCDLVGSSFGAEGSALGATIRESDGLTTLSWLLSESDSAVQKQTLYLLANLASDAVDPQSYLSKSHLLECEAEYRLLPCLDSADTEVVTYACAALQNLCHDPEWSKRLVALSIVPTLEELLSHEDEMVGHYAAGALKNVMAAAALIEAEATAASGADPCRRRVLRRRGRRHRHRRRSAPKEAREREGPHQGGGASTAGVAQELGGEASRTADPALVCGDATRQAMGG